MVLRVELLHACMNTSPVLDEVLKSLSLLPEGLEDAGCVVSPTRKLRRRLPRSTTSRIVADYQAGDSSREVAARYGLPSGNTRDHPEVDGFGEGGTGDRQ